MTYLIIACNRQLHSMLTSTIVARNSKPLIAKTVQLLPHDSQPMPNGWLQVCTVDCRQQASTHSCYPSLNNISYTTFMSQSIILVLHVRLFPGAIFTKNILSCHGVHHVVADVVVCWRTNAGDTLSVGVTKLLYGRLTSDNGIWMCNLSTL